MVGSRQRTGGRSGPASRIRLALGLVAGAVAIALCTVLTDRFVLHAEWWQVRHTVTADPVAPQAAIGPPPGPLTASWERTTPMHHGPVAGYDSVAYDVAQGQVVVASGDGLEVRDARTGDSRWSYRRSGWTLLGWASTRSRLIAYFERDGHRGERLFAGFDALSGGLLWRREGERPAAASRATLRFPAGAGVVLATDEERRTVSGRSAETGARVWERRLPGRCRLFEGAAHPSDAREKLAALALDCPGRSRLLALDPATGRVVFDRTLGSPESPEVAMLDGVTLASDGTALRAFGPKGSLLAAWKGDAVCGDEMCPAVIADGRLVVVHHPEGERKPRHEEGEGGEEGEGERSTDDENGDQERYGDSAARMEAVDVSSGALVWRRAVPAYAALAQAGDRIYALRPRLSEALLPAGVDIVSPDRGAATTAPAPLAVDPDLPGVRPWMAAAGGLLYVAYAESPPRPEGRARLAALRGGATGTGPAELGGVPESDWPDACELLSRPDLAKEHLDAYVRRPTRAHVGSVKLPHAVSCTYEPPEPGRPKKGESGKQGKGGKGPGRSGEPSPGGTRSGGPSASPGGTPDPGKEPIIRGLTVSVRWVAPNEGTAGRLLDALRSTQAQARPRRDLGDEAYELGPTAGTIALRVGRVIVVVDTDRPPGAAARIAYRLRHPARP
ncbi:outer membrane protein assembly factor BamB family protein [Actinomadura litoris]|uniref:PQQ-binding-like beta-propeller repeat protein n=1 Tax=Actinomadura litoris TaxID=2678616 RepID=A0A7K1L7G3_9ACTN|nr:PQQ-binding-like beta-propeller repeat protein [Actinomadura litoris]MUN40349.1 PQQ-binding-like beta-propeller repeat protein [Actinomadura litoris]